jgi:hypothetical protein
VEKWSLQKRLFSVAGLVTATILMQLAGSFEFVSTVLVTSLFQSVLAVIVGGYALRLVFLNRARKKEKLAKQAA